MIRNNRTRHELLICAALPIFFLSREGTKMSCEELTLGKIIFGYTPRVVSTPQQPVLNATMEQLQIWGDDVSNDGLDAI